MQAEVLLLDKNLAKLRDADRIYQGHLQTVASNVYEVERAVLDADLVIGVRFMPEEPGQILELSADTAPVGDGYHDRLTLIAED